MWKVYIPVWYTITNACGAMLVFKYISSAKWRSHMELLILFGLLLFVYCIQTQWYSQAVKEKESTFSVSHIVSILFGKSA